MKNFKKVVAVLTAATLCLGVSMTAFAAELDSETPNEVQEPGETQKPEMIAEISPSTTTILDADGKEVTPIITEMKEELKEALCQPETMKDILEQGGFALKDGQEVTVIAAGEIKIDANVDGKLDIYFGISSEAGLEEGNSIYILHQVSDDKWEVYESKVEVDENGNLCVSATVDSLSPFAIIKVTSDGKADVLVPSKDPEKPAATIDPNNKDDKTPTSTDKTPTSTDKKDATSAKADASNTTKVVKTTTRTLSPKTGIR